MGEPSLTTLRLGDTVVATYRDGADLDPVLSPRPYLHPVRTLAGTLVSDALPADHPWHLGISVAIQDVDGWNFWGGPTYVRGQGYAARDDHGRIEHEEFERVDGNGFVERLRWVAPAGEPVLTERRQVDVRPLEAGWELEMMTSLTNATDAEVGLGSPATNGRAGAGYGGLFWRLPPGGEREVSTPAGTGEEAAHGSRADWVAWTDAVDRYTLVFARADPRTPPDPWFVRVAEYPGVGLQLAARDPLTLAAGERLTRGLRVLVVDGVLPRQRILTWAEKVS